MLGRLFLTLSGIAQMTGPFLADFNETHVLNPRWPPHARFHNGQTMSMGACLGAATLYYTHRKTPASAAADNYVTATIFASIYWLTGLSAILYPGSKGVDPEFGEGFPQLRIFGTLLTLVWIGYWMEMPKLRRKSVM